LDHAQEIDAEIQAELEQLQQEAKTFFHFFRIAEFLFFWKEGLILT
jgi:hypothetical protein